MDLNRKILHEEHKGKKREPQRKYKKRLLQVVRATTGYVCLAVIQYKFRSKARTVAKKGEKSDLLLRQFVKVLNFLLRFFFKEKMKLPKAKQVLYLTV
jgi:hypothetical protein